MTSKRTRVPIVVERDSVSDAREVKLARAKKIQQDKKKLKKVVKKSPTPKTPKVSKRIEKKMVGFWKKVQQKRLNDSRKREIDSMERRQKVRRKRKRQTTKVFKKKKSMKLNAPLPPKKPTIVSRPPSPKTPPSPKDKPTPPAVVSPPTPEDVSPPSSPKRATKNKPTSRTNAQDNQTFQTVDFRRKRGKHRTTIFKPRAQVHADRSRARKARDKELAEMKDARKRRDKERAARRFREKLLASAPGATGRRLIERLVRAEAEMDASCN